MFETKSHLEENSLPKLPGAYFIPNFIDEELEEMLLAESIKNKGAKEGFISGKIGPFVKVYTPKSFLREQVPSGLVKYVETLKENEIFHENPIQISVNLYEDDTKGMVPHKDGAGTYGTILTVGSPVLLNFWYKPAPEGRVSSTLVFIQLDKGEDSLQLPGKLSNLEIPYRHDVSVYMEPRSLLILSGESFIDWAHGIAPTGGTCEIQKDDIVNSHLLNTPLPSSFERGKRVSIVAWNKRYR